MNRAFNDGGVIYLDEVEDTDETIPSPISDVFIWDDNWEPETQEELIYQNDNNQNQDWDNNWELETQEELICQNNNNQNQK